MPPEPKLASKLAPVSRRRPAAVLIIAAIIALALVAGLIFWTVKNLHQPAQSVTEPFPGQMDPGLVGVWEYRTQVGGRDFYVHYSIHENGHYERVQFIDERGTLEARDGEWRSIESRKGRSDTGVYRLNGANALSMQTPLPEGVQTINYTRTSANPASENPLVGAWQANNVWFNGRPCDFHFEVNPDRTYHFRLEATDTGIFSAANGRWTSTSRWQWSQGQPGGIYRLEDGHAIEMTVPPLGLARLERLPNE